MATCISEMLYNILIEESGFWNQDAKYGEEGSDSHLQCNV